MCNAWLTNWSDKCLWLQSAWSIPDRCLVLSCGERRVGFWTRKLQRDSTDKRLWGCNICSTSWVGVFKARVAITVQLRWTAAEQWSVEDKGIHWDGFCWHDWFLPCIGVWQWSSLLHFSFLISCYKCYTLLYAGNPLCVSGQCVGRREGGQFGYCPSLAQMWLDSYTNNIKLIWFQFGVSRCCTTRGCIQLRIDSHPSPPTTSPP